MCDKPTEHMLSRPKLKLATVLRLKRFSVGQCSCVSAHTLMCKTEVLIYDIQKRWSSHSTCSPTNANLLTWPQLKRGASQDLRQVRAVLQAYIDELHMALKPLNGRTHAGIACTPQDATLLSGMCCNKMMTRRSATHARGLKSSGSIAYYRMQGSCYE